MRTLLASFGPAILGLALIACGGAVVSPLAQASDGGDAAAQRPDGTVPPPSDAETTDVTTPGDAAPCGPPSDPTKAALCVALTPEKILFTSNPKSEGQGPLIVEVFDTGTPDLPDGGTVAALATVTYSANTSGAVDLSKPLPDIRFDNLPAGTVYARAIFVDDPSQAVGLGAGTWLAGYDLSSGLKTVTPLKPRSDPAGVGTALSMDLIALRAMKVTLTRTVAPVGNGEGPATVIAIPTATAGPAVDVFGLGQNKCANLSGTMTAEVDGFVIGKGPYYLAAVLDDFGTANGGLSLPAGALTTLAVTSGGLQVPAADKLVYPANAYSVSATVALDYVVTGDAGTDNEICH